MYDTEEPVVGREPFALLDLPNVAQIRQSRPDSGLGSGGVLRGEKLLLSGTEPESYITEYSLIYEDKNLTPS